MNERLVKETLEQLDWPRLRTLLDATAATELEQLVGHITRSSIIRKHPDSAFETRRKHFAEQIYSYARARFGPRNADRIKATFSLIEDIERGYRHILSTLNATAIHQRPPQVRVSATLSVLWDQYLALNKVVENHIASLKGQSRMLNERFKDEHGNWISPDAVLDGLSRGIAMALILEATQNRWFRRDGIIELPPLLEVADNMVTEARYTYALSLSWSNWQHLETSKRFLGGKLRSESAEAFHDRPEQDSEVVRYLPSDNGPSDAEVYELIARVRLQDRFVQTGLELEFEHQISRLCVGIRNGAALPPHQFITWEEYLAVSMLSDILGYELVDDYSKPQGLRLIEWVRGYAVLKEMATSPGTGEGNVTAPIPMRIHDLDSLSRTLEECGLTENGARQFIDKASLSRRSRDAFDCPLVRVGARSVVLLSPLLLSHNIALALLSNLAREGEHLGSKGSAFEVAVRKVLEGQEIAAIGFSANRDGQTYEYDVVFPWDGYVFVFECKNRSLPSGEPASNYYFDLGIRSAARQVRRLADALAKYPDILQSQFGRSLEDHEIVPCVVHSLPYARLGGLNGVYFTDYSALVRFFQQRYLNVEVPTRGERVSIHDIWKAEKPTVEVFLEQLRAPFQVEMALKHLEVNTITFPLSESVIAQRYDLAQKPRTTESMCAALGVDSAPILATIDKISKSV